jgi:hypothetical protein
MDNKYVSVVLAAAAVVVGLETNTVPMRAVLFHSMCCLQLECASMLPFFQENTRRLVAQHISHAAGV